MALLQTAEQVEPSPPSRWAVLVAHGRAWRDDPARRAIVLDILRRYGLATICIDVSRAVGDSAPAIPAEVDRVSREVQDTAERMRATHYKDFARIGAIGVGEAAAPVLLCAARRGALLGAVVCLVGRDRLTVRQLEDVRVPTLLVVGERDPSGLAITRFEAQHLTGSKRMEIIPGTDDSFGSPGAIDTVGHLAGHWLTAHLTHDHTQ